MQLDTGNLWDWPDHLLLKTCTQGYISVKYNISKISKNNPGHCHFCRHLILGQEQKNWTVAQWSLFLLFPLFHIKKQFTFGLEIKVPNGETALAQNWGDLKVKSAVVSPLVRDATQQKPLEHIKLPSIDQSLPISFSSRTCHLHTPPEVVPPGQGLCHSCIWPTSKLRWPI